jgi:chromosome segregation ATPase
MKSCTPPLFEPADIASLRAERDRLVSELNAERQLRAAATITPFETDPKSPGSIPGWGSASPLPRTAADVERAVSEITRREQILSVKSKAHRHCAAQLTEERAQFEAERAANAKAAHEAEEAVLRMREQLVLERQTFEQSILNQNADLERRQHALAQRESELGQTRVPTNTEPRQNLQPPAASETASRNDESGAVTNELLSGLAKKAVDFAAMIEAVTHTQRKLEETKALQEAAIKSQSDALQDREAALAQREAAASARINAAEAQVDADRQSVAQTQKELAARESQLSELERNLAACDAKLTERDAAHAVNTAKLADQEARLTAKRNAYEAAAEGQRQREAEIERLVQEAQERSAELSKRLADIANAEREILAARQQATELHEAAVREREELDAATAKLRTEAEAVAHARREQMTASSALDQRAAAISEQSAALEEKLRRVAKEADEVNRQTVALHNNRAALETHRAALTAEETELVQRMLVFDESRRKLRESVSSLLAD